MSLYSTFESALQILFIVAALSTNININLGNSMSIALIINKRLKNAIIIYGTHSNNNDIVAACIEQAN